MYNYIEFLLYAERPPEIILNKFYCVIPNATEDRK
jgi:hypothetical protein